MRHPEKLTPLMDGCHPDRSRFSGGGRDLARRRGNPQHRV